MRHKMLEEHFMPHTAKGERRRREYASVTGSDTLLE